MNAGMITRLSHISRNVKDLALSVRFYEERLGFARLGAPAPLSDELRYLLGFGKQAIMTQRMTFGGQEIELVEMGDTARPYPKDSSSSDLWFQHFAIRISNIRIAFDRLFQDCSAPTAIPISILSTGKHDAISLPDSSGGAKVFKFRDPDFHPLELIELSRNNADTVEIEGIDHSAVSVADAKKSICFYSETLGMTVGGRQVNSGITQASLDALPSPVVEVVALEPSSQKNPHLELLAYRSPVGRSLDSAHDTTDIASDVLFFSVVRIRSFLQLPELFPVIVKIGIQNRMALLRDPDGHYLVIAADIALPAPLHLVRYRNEPYC